MGGATWRILLVPRSLVPVCRHSAGTVSGHSVAHSAARATATKHPMFLVPCWSTNGHTLTLAADYEEERLPQHRSICDLRSPEREQTRTIGLVGEYQLFWRWLFCERSSSARFQRQLCGQKQRSSLAGSVDLTGSTELRGAVGTGIKNPGFFELFGFVDGRFIGNACLRPEQSTSWEIGLDQELLLTIALSSSAWSTSNAELEDEIFTSFPAPDFIATPANRDTNQHAARR